MPDIGTVWPQPARGEQLAAAGRYRPRHSANAATSSQKAVVGLFRFLRLRLVYSVMPAAARTELNDTHPTRVAAATVATDTRTYVHGRG